MTIQKNPTHFVVTSIKKTHPNGGRKRKRFPAALNRLKVAPDAETAMHSSPSAAEDQSETPAAEHRRQDEDAQEEPRQQQQSGATEESTAAR